MAVETRKVNISELVMDKGTQQRVLDIDAVERYAGLIKDDVKFPAVEVVKDGKGQLILWHGFHRVNAHLKAGLDSIMANVQDGTLRDALWLSLGANKENGVQNDKSVIKRKLKIVLSDKEWSGKSLREIGRHIGCSGEYVRQVQLKLEQEKLEAESLKEEKAPKTPKGMELRDGLGEVIPQEYEEVFNVRGEIDKVVNKLRAAITSIQELKELEGSDYVNDNNMATNLDNIIKTLEASKPYTLCPLCGGFNKENCSACKGPDGNHNGWVIQKAYESTIKTMGGAE